MADEQLYDALFLRKIMHFLETDNTGHDLSYYWPLYTYIENFLLYWDEYFPKGKFPIYTDTDVGRSVSAWINELRTDKEFANHQLTINLGHVCDARELELLQHSFADS